MRPTLAAIDWSIILLYGVFAVALGAYFTRRASSSIESFFVGDRALPWWLAGTSIVATTFAADTPLAVTGIVASGGISGNWLWWSWAIAHLTGTFFFARLWRRSGVITDAEITELRYGGKPAALLRGLKAVYNGVFVNCLIMAWVIVAMVKISRAFFDVDPILVILVCVVVAVLYTILGGFRSVVVTDVVQFTLGMIGAILLAVIAVQHFGGIGAVGTEGTRGTGLLGSLQETSEAAGRNVAETLDFVPGPEHTTTPVVYFVILLVAGWWRYAEGNTYIMQRLAACKDEGHAQGASLWFAIAHNALRPWPWLLVGLAALVVYPTLAGHAPARLQTAGFAPDMMITVQPASLDVATGGRLTFTGVEPGDRVRILRQEAEVVRDGNALVADFGPFDGTTTALVEIHAAERGATRGLGPLRIELLDREMGYPLLMGRFLPTGLLGLVIASLLAAFMSTIDTHTNWGASYLVQDLYRRFICRDATQRHYVWVSRGFVLVIAVLAGGTALIVESIAEVWRFLITLGAGLGSVSAARWYWSRVTAHAELAAIGVTTVLAVGLQLFCTPTLFGGDNPFFLFELAKWWQILIVAGGSLATWIPVSLFGPRDSQATLAAFAAKVRPPGPGWGEMTRDSREPVMPLVIRFAAGAVIVYGALFGIGELLIGQAIIGAGWLAVVAGLLAWIIRHPTASLAPGGQP